MLSFSRGIYVRFSFFVNLTQSEMLMIRVYTSSAHYCQFVTFLQFDFGGLLGSNYNIAESDWLCHSWFTLFAVYLRRCIRRRWSKWNISQTRFDDFSSFGSKLHVYICMAAWSFFGARNPLKSADTTAILHSLNSPAKFLGRSNSIKKCPKLFPHFHHFSNEQSIYIREIFLF